MIVAVTGATGFLGSHLTTVLLERGHQVRCVVRSPEKAAWLLRRGATVVRADLADVEALTAAFEGADAVVANAALAPGWASTERAAFDDANVQGTRNTFEAVVASGVRRVVKISSVSVQPTQLRTLMVEAEPGFRRSWSALVTNQEYARTKALAEAHAWEVARSRGLDVTVLRPGPIYGPRDPKLTARYARWMQRPVLLAPTLRVPHVHAGDVAEALVGALANPGSAGRAYHVTGEPVSVYELLATWRRIAGAGPRLIPIPVPIRIRYDCSAAARDLGFRPRSLEAGLRDVLEDQAKDSRPSSNP